MIAIFQKLIVDYLVISFKTPSEKFLLDVLHLTGLKWEQIRSYYGLAHCSYYGGIKIHKTVPDGIWDDLPKEWTQGAENPNPDMVILDLSGKGCRMLESLCPDLDWFEFLHTFDFMYREGTAHIARLDIACDVSDGSITYDRIERFTRQEKFICKSKYYTIVSGNREHAVYFGSPKSDRRLRIYDKAMEQGINDKLWVRFEFQLRNDNAMSWYLNWCWCRDIGDLFHGVMADFLRFVTKTKGEIRTNWARAKVCSWWKKFLNNADKIKQLYLPGNAYDWGSLVWFMRKQCASTIKTFLAGTGGDLSQLLALADDAEYNEGQKNILRTLGVCFESD